MSLEMTRDVRLQILQLLLEVETDTAEDLRAHDCKVPHAVQCKINVLKKRIREHLHQNSVPVGPVFFTPPGEYGT